MCLPGVVKHGWCLRRNPMPPATRDGAHGTVVRGGLQGPGPMGISPQAAGCSPMNISIHSKSCKMRCGRRKQQCWLAQLFAHSSAASCLGWWQGRAQGEDGLAAEARSLSQVDATALR